MPPLAELTISSRAPLASLQPWSWATEAGTALDAPWRETCRLSEMAATSATARARAPTTTRSWRKSGALEMVRGVAADISSSPRAPVRLRASGPFQRASFDICILGSGREGAIGSRPISDGPGYLKPRGRLEAGALGDRDRAQVRWAARERRQTA